MFSQIEQDLTFISVSLCNYLCWSLTRPPSRQSLGLGGKNKKRKENEVNTEDIQMTILETAL